MNNVANVKFRMHTPFEEIYVQPAATDNGTALGAAYFVWHQRLGKPRAFVMNHALWGTVYEDCAVASVLDGNIDANAVKVLRFDATDALVHTD